MGKTYFYDPNDNVLETGTIRIVMQHEGTVLWSLGASERRRSHSGIKRAQMIVKSVQILQSLGYLFHEGETNQHKIIAYLSFYFYIIYNLIKIML